MRDSRSCQKDLLRTCALQHKTLNQLRNSGKLLQVILYACNNLFINCSQFDLASTCFTYCRKNFKQFTFLVFPEKFRFVTVHPPYKNLVLEMSKLVSVDRMVLVVKSYEQCICFTVGILKKELFGKRCWRTTFKRRNLFYKIERDLLKGQIGVYHNFSFEKGPL